MLAFGRKQTGLGLPFITLLLGGIVSQPAIDIVIVQAVPVEKIPGSRYLLLIDRKDVTHQQTIELSIAQVVGKVQRDLLAVEQLDGLPKQFRERRIIE